MPFVVDHPTEARAIAHARLILSGRDEPDVERLTRRLQRIALATQVARLTAYVSGTYLMSTLATWFLINTLLR